MKDGLQAREREERPALGGAARREEQQRLLARFRTQENTTADFETPCSREDSFDLARPKKDKYSWLRNTVWRLTCIG